MTRNQLLASICPSSRLHDCEKNHCFDCNKELNKCLNEYDKYVIEQYKANTEFKNTIKEIHDNVSKEMYDLSHYIKVSTSPSGCNSYDAEQFKCDRYLDCDSCLEDKIIEHDKHIIEQYKENTKLKDIHDNVSHEMYCKGIDDFVEKVELKYLGVNPDELYEKYYPREICEQIKEIAYQLKACY